MKMIFDKLHQLYHWLLKWAEHKHNTKALAILSFLEASIFPLPVDPLLLAMGFGKPKRSLYYAFLTTLFSVIGALGGYYIGMQVWQQISGFFFQYVFPEAKFNVVVQSLHGATFVSIFIAGFSPIPFKIFTIAAGVVGAPLPAFVLGAIASRGLRYFILGTLIFFMGDQIRDWIENNFEKLTIAISVAIVLFLALYISLF
ncbi:MAG: DedA family protein [Bdellovibrionales bacterium]|nr:DedA family protein [Bdellovibrionales bacterium]